MDQLKMRCSDYSIWQISKENLRKVAEFVVLTNYKHHQNNILPSIVNQEIEKIHKNEEKYYEHSLVYAIKDNIGNILGTIRVMKWNKVDLLPIQEDFHIEIRDFIDEQTDVWHIGRFAVDSSINSFKIILLFKTLLAYAITPICKTQNSVMFAECDTKLFATLKKLQMDVKEIGKSMGCLGSETVPIFGCSNGLYPFLRNNLRYTASFSSNAS